MIKRLQYHFDNSAPRTATTLELMYDLASVLAVASAAFGLHHGMADNHPFEAIVGFLIAFFMIWWSWMNYTWFASAYDDSSSSFRMLTMVAMFGALTIAAGIPAVFLGKSINVALIGFVVLRVALASLWFISPTVNKQQRLTSILYGTGILTMQVYWILIVLSIDSKHSLYLPLFILGMIGEISVPYIAESKGTATPWHRHHIIERYGLMTIIVLGECFLSIVSLLRPAENLTTTPVENWLAAISCAAITFCMFSIYFLRGNHLPSSELKLAFKWGYGHYFIFSSIAATGAGFALIGERLSHHLKAPVTTANWALAIPIAVFCLTTWFVRDKKASFKDSDNFSILAVAVIVLSTPIFSKDSHYIIAIIMCLYVFFSRPIQQKHQTT